MRSLIKGALLGAGLLFTFAGAAQAETLEVNVPFAFLVGSTEMPAGQYRIERDSSMPASVILIRGEHGNTARLFVQTTPLMGAKPAGDSPALIFVPDETANRLTQVWGNGATGQELAVARGKTHRVGYIVVFGQSRG
jgi:hypothetical protein